MSSLKLAAAITLAISSSANAALIERLDGMAYYDDVADLTWLADAKYAMTSGYDDDGLMSWDQANAWVASLDINGVTGWRLPDTLQPDASCGDQSGGVSSGYHCTGSEMGNLFYNVLGNSVDSLTNTGPFSNVLSTHYWYWSATEYAANTDYAWLFSMYDGGYQFLNFKSNTNSVWAVRSGDVSAVPVPAAVWLFGSGLIGLAGFARRKKV